MFNSNSVRIQLIISKILTYSKCHSRLHFSRFRSCTPIFQWEGPCRSIGSSWCRIRWRHSHECAKCWDSTIRREHWFLAKWWLPTAWLFASTRWVKLKKAANLEICRQMMLSKNSSRSVERYQKIPIIFLFWYYILLRKLACATTKEKLSVV